jgi:hypothetical protein
MSRSSRWTTIVWIVVAVLLAVGSTAGGDTSIVTGFLWLAWTAPISLIWQFWIYDTVLRFVPANIANVMGLLLVLALAYAFWFQLVPALFRGARRNKGPQS